MQNQSKSLREIWQSYLHIFNSYEVDFISVSALEMLEIQPFRFAARYCTSKLNRTNFFPAYLSDRNRAHYLLHDYGL